MVSTGAGAVGKGLEMRFDENMLLMEVARVTAFLPLFFWLMVMLMSD